MVRLEKQSVLLGADVLGKVVKARRSQEHGYYSSLLWPPKQLRRSPISFREGAFQLLRSPSKGSRA